MAHIMSVDHIMSTTGINLPFAIYSSPLPLFSCKYAPHILKISRSQFLRILSWGFHRELNQEPQFSKLIQHLKSDEQREEEEEEGKYKERKTKNMRSRR